MSTLKLLGRVGAGACALLMLATTAACSGDSAGSSEGGGSNGSAVEAVEYDGPEADVAASFGEPSVVDGASFTVGWLSPMISNNFVGAIADAAQKRVEELGGTLIIKDAVLDVSKQVDQCNELVARGVDALAVYPVDPSSLGPCLADAAAAGIPIIGQDTPPIVGTDLFENYASNVSQGPDRAAYNVATIAAQSAGPEASFATLGVAIPVPLLKYYTERLAFWAEAYGLEYLGNVDSDSDDAQSDATAMNDILTRWPDVDVVLTYHGQSALAASSAARAAGNTDVLIYGNYSEKAVMDLIEADRIAGSNWVDTEGIGVQIVNGLYNLVTEQNLPLEKQLVVVPGPITKDNLGEITPIQ